MEDVKSKAKKAVLEEIMALMDESESEGLKAKSPKFMKMEVEAESLPAEGEEMPLDMEAEGDAMPDDDKERLKELYEKYC